MASVGTYQGKDGRIYTRVLFVDPRDGRRRTLRLGRVNKEQAATVKGMIERLVKGRTTGTPDAVAGTWLAGLPDAAYGKLVKLGLAEPRIIPSQRPELVPAPKVCLGQFLADYLKSRTDIKPQSAVVLGHTIRNLRDFFGVDKALDSISEGDADKFKMYLGAQGLSVATIARRCGFAKQFLRSAVRHRLIASNPFGDLRSCAKANKERQRYISPEDTQKLLDACPCDQWRLLVALARFAGLRSPSETLRLRWSDIDWERGRITVHSPKTERYGKDSRVIPLFASLRPFLMEMFEQAEPGTTRCVTRYREDTPNLAVEFARIALRAGLPDLPKPFVNCRSSCETDLAAIFPIHTVCQWLGNTPKIAEAHYLQTRPEDFERAIQSPADADGATHRTAQQIGETSREKSQTAGEPVHANRVLPVETGVCESLQVLANEGLGQGRI